MSSCGKTYSSDRSYNIRLENGQERLMTQEEVRVLVRTSIQQAKRVQHHDGEIEERDSRETIKHDCDQDDERVQVGSPRKSPSMTKVNSPKYNINFKVPRKDNKKSPRHGSNEKSAEKSAIQHDLACETKQPSSAKYLSPEEVRGLIRSSTRGEKRNKGANQHSPSSRQARESTTPTGNSTVSPVGAIHRKFSWSSVDDEDSLEASNRRPTSVKDEVNDVPPAILIEDGTPDFRMEMDFLRKKRNRGRSASPKMESKPVTPKQDIREEKPRVTSNESPMGSTPKHHSERYPKPEIYLNSKPPKYSLSTSKRSSPNVTDSSTPSMSLQPEKVVSNREKEYSSKKAEREKPKRDKDSLETKKPKKIEIAKKSPPANDGDSAECLPVEQITKIPSKLNLIDFWENEARQSSTLKKSSSGDGRATLPKSELPSNTAPSKAKPITKSIVQDLSTPNKSEVLDSTYLIAGLNENPPTPKESPNRRYAMGKMSQAEKLSLIKSMKTQPRHSPETTMESGDDNSQRSAMKPTVENIEVAEKIGLRNASTLNKSDADRNTSVVKDMPRSSTAELNGSLHKKETNISSIQVKGQIDIGERKERPKPCDPPSEGEPNLIGLGVKGKGANDEHCRVQTFLEEISVETEEVELGDVEECRNTTTLDDSEPADHDGKQQGLFSTENDEFQLDKVDARLEAENPVSTLTRIAVDCEPITSDDSVSETLNGKMVSSHSSGVARSTVAQTSKKDFISGAQRTPVDSISLVEGNDAGSNDGGMTIETPRERNSTNDNAQMSHLVNNEEEKQDDDTIPIEEQAMTLEKSQGKSIFAPSFEHVSQISLANYSENDNTGNIEVQLSDNLNDDLLRAESNDKTGTNLGHYHQESLDGEFKETKTPNEANDGVCDGSQQQNYARLIDASNSNSLKSNNEDNKHSKSSTRDADFKEHNETSELQCKSDSMRNDDISEATEKFPQSKRKDDTSEVTEKVQNISTLVANNDIGQDEEDIKERLNNPVQTTATKISSDNAAVPETAPISSSGKQPKQFTFSAKGRRKERFSFADYTTSEDEMRTTHRSRMVKTNIGESPAEKKKLDIMRSKLTPMAGLGSISPISTYDSEARSLHLRRRRNSRKNKKGEKKNEEIVVNDELLTKIAALKGDKISSDELGKLLAIHMNASNKEEEATISDDKIAYQSRFCVNFMDLLSAGVTTETDIYSAQSSKESGAESIHDQVESVELNADEGTKTDSNENNEASVQDETTLAEDATYTAEENTTFYETEVENTESGTTFSRNEGDYTDNTRGGDDTDNGTVFTEMSYHIKDGEVVLHSFSTRESEFETTFSEGDASESERPWWSFL